MLLYCKINGLQQNCLELFREEFTEEGLCCVFNVLHPGFLYKRNVSKINHPIRTDPYQPVDWNPETGYQKDLPLKFYPRKAFGSGMSMGLTLILHANVNEYLCSSINGPGFKVTLHNPIESPDIKEAGLTVPIGFETRLRINPIQSHAVPAIRCINRNVRQCLFQDEAKELLYYQYYTRRNCERECRAQYFYRSCQCIPFAFPLIYVNSSECTAEHLHCIEKALLFESNNYCQKRCFPACFDLNYMPDFFSSPLALRNYTIPIALPRNISQNIRNDIAVIHLYYQESVFYGDLKNVYVGLTEFLSNTGGIMGLFMGFSIISFVEVLYFTFLCPIFQYFPRLQPKIRKVRPVTKSKRILRIRT